jgi:hypothetical protein
VTCWIPVRRILRQAFGAGNFRILRSGTIEIRRAGAWSTWGSLLEQATLQRIEEMA